MRRKTIARTGEDCLCLGLRKASRVVTQLYDEALRPSGLQATQLPLLSMSAALGRVALSELAWALAMDRTTLSRNLRPLERDGFIRTARGSDRRVREVWLTEQGKQALAEAYPLWEQARARVARAFGQSRLRHLVLELAATVEAVRSPLE